MLGIRDNLAAVLLASGRSRDGIEHYKRRAADTEAAAGRDHPDAITARPPGFGLPARR